MLTTYFGALHDNLTIAVGSRCDALHIDLVRAPEQLDAVLRAVRSPMRLSLGVIDGRNIWRTDLDAAHAIVRRAVRALGREHVLVAPSCSLLHVPVDVASERKMDTELKSWLAFAVQKLDELRLLADTAELDQPTDIRFAEERTALSASQQFRRA